MRSETATSWQVCLISTVASPVSSHLTWCVPPLPSNFIHLDGRCAHTPTQHTPHSAGSGSRVVGSRVVGRKDRTRCRSGGNVLRQDWKNRRGLQGGGASGLTFFLLSVYSFGILGELTDLTA